MLPNGEEVKWSTLSRRARREQRALNRKPLGPRIIDMYRYAFASRTPIWAGFAMVFLSFLFGFVFMFCWVTLLITAFEYNLVVGWIVTLGPILLLTRWLFRLVDSNAQAYKKDGKF